MQNPGTCHSHSAYYQAVQDADEEMRSGLTRVGARLDMGLITVREAADERIVLLERHLQRLHEIRTEHLGAP